MAELMELHKSGFLKAVVNRCDGSLSFSIEVFHVVRSWMPIWLVGTSVASQVISIPSVKESISSWNIANRDDGLFIVAENQQDVKILSNEFPVSLRNEVKRQMLQEWIGQKGFIGTLSKSPLRLAIASILTMVTAAYLMAPKHKIDSLQTGSPASVSTTAGLENGSGEISESDLRLLSSSAVAQERSAKESAMSPSEAIVKAAKINLRTENTKAPHQIFVWADPFCSNCRAIEPLLESLDSEISVSVIPVAFKEGSRVLVSYMFCGASAAEQTARWNGMMQDKPIGKIDQQCASGPGVADENSTLFLRGGMSSTPTIMKANGEIFHGELSKLAVSNWAKAK